MLAPPQNLEILFRSQLIQAFAPNYVSNSRLCNDWSENSRIGLDVAASSRHFEINQLLKAVKPSTFSTRYCETPKRNRAHHGLILTAISSAGMRLGVWNQRRAAPKTTQPAVVAGSDTSAPSHPMMGQTFLEAAGLGRLGTHWFRHTYRAWLDSVGTDLAVHQKAMRHTDIRTTMSYGGVVDGRIN